MFRIRDLKNGLYQVHKKNGPAFEGTPNLLFKKAVEMGIQEKELVFAVLRLSNEGHDYADFDGTGRLKYLKRGK